LAHKAARTYGHYLPRLPRCHVPIRVELLQLSFRRSSARLGRLCGLPLASSPQKKYWASPQQTKAGVPIRPRPKSYALTDFFLYGCHIPPTTAEEALINARVVQHDPYLAAPQATGNYTGPKPSKARPGRVGVALSLAHPACPNGPPEALPALGEGADTLLPAIEKKTGRG